MFIAADVAIIFSDGGNNGDDDDDDDADTDADTDGAVGVGIHLLLIFSMAESVVVMSATTNSVAG